MSESLGGVTVMKMEKKFSDLISIALLALLSAAVGSVCVCLPFLVDAAAEDVPTAALPIKEKAAKLKTVDRENLGAVKISLLKAAILSAGQTTKDVLRLLGEPSSRSTSKESKTESWRYGKSMVFFSEGSVAAWSDAGELTVRHKLKKPPQANEESFASDGWTNVWQRSSSVDSQEVIDELFVGDKKK